MPEQKKALSKDWQDTIKAIKIRKALQAQGDRAAINAAYHGLDITPKTVENP